MPVKLRCYFFTSSYIYYDYVYYYFTTLMQSLSLIASTRQSATIKERQGKLSIARKSRFVADSLERFLGPQNDVEIADIDADFLARYSSYLLREGMRENTLSNYLRVIQNTVRTAAKAGLDCDTTVFKSFFTGNSKAVKRIPTVDDLRRLFVANLEGKGVMQRTRDLFLLCFFAGGLSIRDLLQTEDENPRLARIAMVKECRALRQRYPAESLLSFLGSDPLDRYAHNLNGLALTVGLDKQLTDDAAAEAWAEVAKQLSLSTGVIATIVGRPLANLNYADHTEPHTPGAIQSALLHVADRIGMDRTHWYVMRCYGRTPQQTSAAIMAMTHLKTLELKTFVPPVTINTEREGVQRQTLLMRSTLFVNCLPLDILAIRRQLAADIRVYDYAAEGVKVPAIISDDEMRLFMYLSEVSSDSLIYYFPDELDTLPTYRKEEEVTIVEGPYAGSRARIYKGSKDSLKVFVTLEGLNVIAYAEVPYRFIVPHKR
jgi:hypothetical protein